MPSGPHDKKGQDEDRTGGSPPAHVPQRTSYLDIFSESPVEQATLEELLAPDAAAAARPEGIALGEWILTGRREFLLRAFQTDARTTFSVVVAHARSSEPRWVAIAPTLALALVSLLEEGIHAAEGQASAEALVLEQKPFVRLYLAGALAWITRESEAFDTVLSEAAALGMMNEAYDAVRVIRNFEPLEVMPHLSQFMRGAFGRGQAAWEVFLTIIIDLINCEFGAYDAYRNRPADAERCRDMTLLLLAELLTQERLDEWIKEYLTDIVRTRATPLGGDLKAVVAKLGESSGVAADEVAWRIYGAVLPAHESNRKDREAAIEWAMEHPSKVEEDPSAWRVYYCILRYSKEKAYRIKSIQYLGAHVPTSTLRPLPTDVAEVWKLLNSLADQDEDSDLQQEAKAAIAQIIQRGRDEGARETRSYICEIAQESSAALSCEWIPRFVEPPRLLISINLTIFPRSEETSFVPRIDAASQEVSLGPTAAPPPNLDLSSHQFTTNGVGDGFSRARFSTTPAAAHVDRVDLATASFTTTDSAVQHTRMLISGPGGNIGLAKAEQERFRDRYQALGPLVESGEINAAVLKGPMAALNKAYRELNGAESERVLGVSEAAEMLGLTRSRVQQLAREGLGQKVAGRFLFSREELGQEKQRPRSKGGRPPTADWLDLAAVSFTTSDPSVQHTRMLVSGPGGNMGLAKAEQERFRDRYQALGPLVESGEINAAVLKGPMAALNEAYRELDVEGGASRGGEFPPPRDLERKPGWADRSFEREALPTTSTGSERVLGVSEAAEVLGLTRSRVQQLAREGLGQKVAGRFLFSREELEQEKQRPRSKGGRPPIPRNEDRGKAEPSLKTHSPNVE